MFPKATHSPFQRANHLKLKLHFKDNRAAQKVNLLPIPAQARLCGEHLIPVLIVSLKTTLYTPASLSIIPKKVGR